MLFLQGLDKHILLFSCTTLLKHYFKDGEFIKMRIGYVRVSSKEQNTARQETLMKQLNVERLYIDKSSGKNMNRQQLQAMLEFIRDGDIVVVESYSRLARSTKDLLHILEKLKSKNVQLISQKENFNTSTPQGHLMLTFFAGLYEFERECILERQKEGIALAKAQGKYKGRKPIEVDMDKFKTLYDKWKANKITAVYMMKQLGLTRSTFYRKIKHYEKQQNKL